MNNYINDIPIAKTFIVNNNYYIYDTYKNHILSVSKSHYIEIKELFACGLHEYIDKKIGIKAVCLPSTSPANATYSLDRLCEEWSNAIIEK